MKTRTNYEFQEQYRVTAEEYISYKQSLGFKFGYDDQKKCAHLLNYLYNNSNDNDILNLKKETVDGYLNLFVTSRPSTIHASQSYVRQYALFLKRKGFDPYIYPATLIQCPKILRHIYFQSKKYKEYLKVLTRLDPIGINFSIHRMYILQSCALFMLVVLV